MKNKERKVKFINMLKSCITGEISGIREKLDSLLKKTDLDFQDECFLLFLIGEYTRISEDMFFYLDKKVQTENLQNHVKEAAYQPYCRLNGKEAGLFSDNLGMAYGALYNSNLFGKREEIAEAIHEMKNYAYNSYTSEGKLVDEKHGEKATAQMLWLCVPFGLFTPEDLVLVAALPQMQDTQEELDFAMLGWYFAEKADYRKARSYLSRLDSGDDFVQAIKGVTEEKLKQAGMLSEVPLLHIPCGNSNRYEHQNYEREPWLPKEKEEVYLNAVTWPVQIQGEVEVCYSTSMERQGCVKGRYQPEYENYRFGIGCFEGGEEVTYYFRAGVYCSEKYRFTVLRKETVIGIGAVRKEGVSTVVEMCSDKGSTYSLVRTPEKGHCLYSVTALETENMVSKETKWKPFRELNSILFFALEESDKQIYDKWILPIDEIYFWKSGNEIISSGMKVRAEKKEHFYGFGERYNQIDQRGNKVDVYVYNQYKNQGIRTYLPMPYFLSSRQYGIYLPTGRYVEFDMCSSDDRYWQAEAEDKILSWYCFNGNPKEMIGQFTSLTGKPAMMPEWAFGPWMSSNNWDSEAEVRKQAELSKKYDIPSTVLVIEAWSDEATYYIFNDAVYEENSGKEGFTYGDFKFPKWGKWPDPKGMVEYLHENGMKCILWQIPIIKYINSLHHLQKDRDEEYAISRGFCVKNKDGLPYRMPEGWFTDSLLMDYTNEEATEWWLNKRQYLVDEVGIDGFKTDGGEFVFGDEVQFADGRTGKEMRNEYPNLYIRKHYEYIHEKRNGIVFSRAGFTGAAQMPAHWAGDEKSTFSAFQRNLCAGLNAGISGVSFWGWDLAGFSGEIPSAELYVRSVAMAAFCPIMQYHAESKAEFNQDRTPWNIAERRQAPWVIDVYRYYAKLRMAMLPYIMDMAKQSVESGVPMMRALWIEFPKDDECSGIFNQYMFGDDFMVAPIVEEGMEERLVYIPEGEWKNMFTGEEFAGMRWKKMHASVEEIIVLQRKESEWVIEIGERQGCMYIKTDI